MFRFAKDFVFYGLSRALSKFCALFLLPLFVRLLTKEEMGVLGVCATLSGAVAVLADLQIASAMGRFFHAESDSRGRGILVGTGFLAVSVLSLFMALLLCLMVPLVGRWVFGDKPFAWTLYFVAAQTPFVAWNSYLLYVLRLASRPKAYLLATSVTTLVTAGLSAVLVLGFAWGISGALVGQVVGIVAGFLIVIGATHRNVRLQFDGRRFRELAAFGLPSVPAVAGSWLQNSVGVGVVLAYFSLQEVGVYSVAFRIASGVALYQMSFGLAWFPYAMSVMSRPDHKEQYATGFAIYIGIGALLVAGVTLYAPEIVGLIAGAGYAGASPLIGMLGLAVIAEGMVIPGSLGIMILKKTYLYSIGYAVSLVVNAAVMVLLIRPLGVQAVAAGLLSGRLAHAGFVYWVSQRLYPIRHYNRLIALSLGCCLAAVFLAHPLSGLSWVSRLAILIGAGGLLGVLTRPVWPRLAAVAGGRSE